MNCSVIVFRSEQYAEEISTEEIQVVSEENLQEKMYNPWKDNFEPQNRERTESGYSSGSFAPYAAPEGGAPYTPFEQYDSNSAIYSPSVQLRFYFYIERKWTFRFEELGIVHFLTTIFARFTN